MCKKKEEEEVGPENRIKKNEYGSIDINLSDIGYR